MAKNAGIAVENAALKLFTLSGGEKLMFKKVWDTQAGIDLVDAAKQHSIYFTFRNFMKMMDAQKNEEVRRVLKNLAVLFAYTVIQEEATSFTLNRVLTADHFETIKEIYQEHIELLEPDFLVLAEAFHLPDSITMSDIGHSNGTPYKNLLETVKRQGMLNQKSTEMENLIKKIIEFKASAPKL